MLDSQTAPKPKIETWVLPADQLEKLFDNVKRGDVIVYAVGDIAHERWRARGKLWADVETTAELAYHLWRVGEAELTQKKLAPNKYEYRLVKR